MTVPQYAPQYIPLGRRYLLKKSDDFAASHIAEACLRRGSAEVVLGPPYVSLQAQRVFRAF